MCLSANSLRQGQVVKLRQASKRKRIKLVENNSKLSTLHVNNNSCEEKLLDDLSTSTYSDFKNCSCVQLTAFIHCCLFGTTKKPSSAKYNGVRFKKSK